MTEPVEESKYKAQRALEAPRLPHSRFSSPCSTRYTLSDYSRSSEISRGPAHLGTMDPFSDSTDEQSQALKQKFWSRVRRVREKRRNRFERESFGLLPARFDVCSRRTTRNIVRFSYLAAACAFSSIITLYYSSVSAYSAFDMAFGSFAHPDGGPLDVNSPYYPSTYLRSVMPIPCHSHNDQWRHTPLHAALGTGCISIEADIWASPDPSDEKIFVGHDQGALLPDRTLEKMYITPLINILELHNQKPITTQSLTGIPSSDSEHTPAPSTPANGVFALSPLTSLTLLLDFKSTSDAIFPALLHNIAPLIKKDWLTCWDSSLQKRIERPITLVASGDADFDLILRGGNASINAPTDIRRYVFYDAPLHDLIHSGDPDAPPATDAINIDLQHVSKGDRKKEEVRGDNNRAAQLYRYHYNPSNSHFASTSLAMALGPVSPILSQPDSAQRQVIRGQIRAARDRGLISRYWGTPRWPRGLRDNVWESLEMEGVGLLSVDDLRGVRKGDWGRRAGGRWWGRKRDGKMAWFSGGA